MSAPVKMPNPKLAPYRLKMAALAIGQTLVIPWQEFGEPDAIKLKNRERPISNGTLSWLLTARDYGLEVKRIE